MKSLAIAGTIIGLLLVLILVIRLDPGTPAVQRSKTKTGKATKSSIRTAPTNSFNTTPAEARRSDTNLTDAEMTKLGLDPKETYQFWPLVYDRDWKVMGSSIVGTVTNYGSTPVRIVRVDFDLYDYQGNKVGSAWDIVNRLDAGETWKYKAFIFDRDAQRYRLRGFQFMD
jgi:hypothetical protein